jgi:hypothetical protein
VATSFFSTGGFPNFSWQYIAVLGGTVFDPEALMYWGRHDGEEHNDKDFDHCYHGIYKVLWKEYIDSNNAFFDKFLPNSGSDKKVFESYFDKLFAAYSVSMLFDYLALGKRFRGEKVVRQFNEKAGELNFPVRMHLGILAKRPIYSFTYALLALKSSFQVSIGRKIKSKSKG